MPGRMLRLADEIRDKRVLRLVVDILRSSDLLYRAVLHDDDGVGHCQRLFLVVRDIDEGYLHLLLYSLELYLHLLAQLQVERAERLVEKEHLRVVDQSARDRDSLLLAA